MRTIIIRGAIASVTAAACLLATTPGQAADLSEADRKEVQRVGEALEDGSLPWPPGWTLGHGASKEGLKEAEPIGIANSVETLEAVVRKAGGWKKYKAEVASLLNSKDAVVRGFAAAWLADLGDRRYGEDLFALLKSDSTPTKNNPFPGYDRQEAAIALGILGARDHAKDLAGYLKLRSSEIRAAAVLGLGYMHAQEYQADIACLLDDDNPGVAAAAISALAEMGAKQYAVRFSEIALNDGQMGDVVLEALVKLGAKDQVPKIAPLLKEGKWDDRARATMALAKLGCREYAKEFATIIDQGNSYDRSAAICALGILGETKYADKIAERLKSEERSDRQAAAWSLVMMESKPHAAEAVATYDEFEAAQSSIPPVISPMQGSKLRKQFKESLSRMKTLAGKESSK